MFPTLQPPALLQLRNRRAHAVYGQRIFVPDVENALPRSDRDRCDHQSFDHAERKRLENHPIHERPWIPFVAVADPVFGAAGLLRDDAPLLAGRESRSAAPAQARPLDCTNDFVCAPASWSAAVLCRFFISDRARKSARGLAHSKT